MSNPHITFKHVTLDYADGRPTTALSDVSFSIAKGEFITIFGPNGSGKTSLLNLIAGLETPTSGVIKRPKDCTIGYVFQNYQESLLPWRTVYENIALAFENTHQPKKTYDSDIQKIAQVLKLNAYLDKYPYMLSGGQKQLTVLARALVVQPDVILMDEPFASLDYTKAIEMGQLVHTLWKEFSITTILVSHDIDEAILLGSKLFVVSQKDTTHIKEIAIPLGPNRDVHLLTNDVFTQIKRNVLEKYVKTV